jgi:hypothetical protein
MFPTITAATSHKRKSKKYCAVAQNSIPLFFGAFAKLRKATVSFVTSVCPSVCNNWAPTGRIFMKFYTGVCFENRSRKFKFH